jgi:hypothetical protein
MMTARICLILAALAALSFAPAALAEHHEGKGKGHAKGLEKSQQKMDDAKERATEAREGAEERAEGAREGAEDRAEKAAGGRGEEMQTRRDERKGIMEEAKGATETGTPPKGKKSWWRFWESDDE